METRTIKELLTILKEYIKTERHFSGMCISLIYMWERELINEAEQIVLDRYIMKNRPANVPGYWWPQGNRVPRVVWLNEQIAKL